METLEFRDTGKREEDIELTQYDVTRKALTEFITKYAKYLECKEHLENKEASLMIHTDWGTVFDSKPTVAMKDAHIKECTHTLHGKVNEAYLSKREAEELYKLELLRYEKEGEI